MPLSRMAASAASLLNMTKLSTVCGRTAERLASRPCSPKRFRTVPEFILLSPGMAPAVTSLSVSVFLCLCLFFFSFCLSVSVSVCLSVSLCLCLSVCLCIQGTLTGCCNPRTNSVSRCLCLCPLSVPPSVCLSLCVCLTLSAFRGP